MKIISPAASRKMGALGIQQKSNKRRAAASPRVRVVEVAPSKWRLYTNDDLNGAVILVPRGEILRRYISRLEKFLAVKIHVDDIEYYSLSREKNIGRLGGV